MTTIIREEKTMAEAVEAIRIVRPQPAARMIDGLPDPLAQQLWETLNTDLEASTRSRWARTQLSVAFAAWGGVCFLLGWLS